MRIIVVGLGLIGGSFCRAIKKYTDHHVIGIDRDEPSLDMALAMEAVDEIIPMDRMDLLKKGDLVIVALPPRTIVDFILDNVNNFREGALVTDVCGVKEYIVSHVEEPLRAAGVQFIGSHPMAGTEFAGFAASKSDMFVNASYLLTPTENAPEHCIRTLRDLAMQIGFKTVIQTSPENHDQVIAYTSQLAHVTSNSYIRSSTLPREKGFSAGSFLDMTRVALLDENMWSDIFILNKKNIVNETDQLIQHLTQLRDLIDSEDREGIRELLEKGRKLKTQNTMQRKLPYSNTKEIKILS